MSEHVALLRRAVAALLEFADARDAALAGLLDAIADAIEEASRVLGEAHASSGPIVDNALRTARLILGRADG